jgi:hypothetical protein
MAEDTGTNEQGGAGLTGDKQKAAVSPKELSVVDGELNAFERGSAFVSCRGDWCVGRGVEAYIEFFVADHKSHMVEILARHTSMPVAEIVHGTVPEPDDIYILPP